VQLLLAMQFREKPDETKSVMWDITYLVKGVDKILRLLGCYSKSYGKYLPTFRMNLSYPASVQEQRSFVRRLDPEIEVVHITDHIKENLYFQNPFNYITWHKLVAVRSK
jgi:hypothetical protein